MRDKRYCHVALVALLLLLAMGPLLAQDGEEPPARVVDRASEVIATNMQRQIDRLTALLDRAPEQAQTGIQHAIESLQKGMTDALAALGGPESSEDGDTPETNAAVEGQTAPEVETSGPDRARQAIADGTAHAETALEGAMSAVPEDARGGLEKALSRIASACERALTALDRAGTGAPEHTAAGQATSRPEGAGRPEQATRPDRPTRPERPEPAEVPSRPERPTRHDG